MLTLNLEAQPFHVILPPTVQQEALHIKTTLNHSVTSPWELLCFGRERKKRGGGEGEFMALSSTVINFLTGGEAHSFVSQQNQLCGEP